MRRAAAAAAVLCVVGLTGCGPESNVTHPIEGPVVGPPLLSFPPASHLPAANPAGLPRLTAAPSGTGGLSWKPVSEDPHTHVLTIETLFGGCTSAPTGFTLTGPTTAPALTVLAPAHAGTSCTDPARAELSTLALPPADSPSTLLHGPVYN